MPLVDEALDLAQQATPSAPPGSGRNKVYTKSDNSLYLETSAGAEVLIGPSTAVAPTGAVTQFAAAAAPTGWLLCDGAAVSRTTYSALFTLISTTYGAGNGTTTFNVPNLKGRVPVGQDTGQTEFDVLGETGGEKSHVLTTTEMPSHTHPQTGKWTASTTHSHSGTGGGGAEAPNPSSGAASGMGDTAASGSGGAHNNLQPYLVMTYIIKP